MYNNNNDDDDDDDDGGLYFRETTITMTTLNLATRLTLCALRKRVYTCCYLPPLFFCFSFTFFLFKKIPILPNY